MSTAARRVPKAGGRPIGQWLLSTLVAVCLLLAAAALSAWLAHRHRNAILQYLRQEWPTVLATEIVFLAFFAFWLAIVAVSYTHLTLPTKRIV